MDRAAGRRAAALAAYAEALEEVDEIRQRRGVAYGADPSTQHEVAQRAYLEYVDLLLARAAEDEHDPAGPGPSSATMREAVEADLALAQRTLEQSKVDELRDYFDDECVDAALREEVEAGQVDPDSVLVYPIPLPDRLELLVSSRHGRQRFSVPVTADEIATTAQRFRQDLQNRMTRRHLRPARQLYDWLIRPLASSLAKWNTKTLVFVPGGPLRAVPMAALHDGDRYLIEAFAVAMTPGLDLTHPRPVDRSEALALFGGLSESVDGFEALPEVAGELATLSQILEGTILIDERFNPETVRKELGRRPFSVVHIASHAGFESADEAYVLTHDGKISVDQFAETISLFRDRDQPLELLMLSACETAEGDERAALGLSGIGVKAGARSAVGSLWLVSDEAARGLSTRFYRALFEDGASRAEALRSAQLELLAQDAYRHPFYWAPFILIGNWL
jgi:CHAT domain-containing protein